MNRYLLPLAILLLPAIAQAQVPPRIVTDIGWIFLPNVGHFQFSDGGVGFAMDYHVTDGFSNVSFQTIPISDGLKAKLTDGIDEPIIMSLASSSITRMESQLFGPDVLNDRVIWHQRSPLGAPYNGIDLQGKSLTTISAYMVDGTYTGDALGSSVDILIKAELTPEPSAIVLAMFGAVGVVGLVMRRRADERERQGE